MAKVPMSKAVGYSTTEVDTGETWIDGKKIYQKIFTETGPSASDSWKNFETGLAIDKVISIEGYALTDLGGLIFINSCVNATAVVLMTLQSDKKLGMYCTYNRCLNQPWTFTIKYTKSS